jgi:hypothetical protein
VAKKPKGKDDSLNRLSKELQELAEPFGGWLSGHAAELPTPVTFADLEGPLLVGVGLMQRLNGAALTGWRPVQPRSSARCCCTPASWPTPGAGAGTRTTSR